MCRRLSERHCKSEHEAIVWLTLLDLRPLVGGGELSSSGSVDFEASAVGEHALFSSHPSEDPELRHDGVNAFEIAEDAVRPLGRVDERIVGDSVEVSSQEFQLDERRQSERGREESLTPRSSGDSSLQLVDLWFVLRCVVMASQSNLVR
jgi:hypothetical protein